MFAAITATALTDDVAVTLLPAVSGKQYLVLGWHLTIHRGTVPSSADGDQYTIKAGSTPIGELSVVNAPNIYTSARGHRCGLGEAVTLTPQDIPDAASVSGHVEYELV